ncbi:MAG: sulfatase [Myxococcota bacterium]|nr:sulfatase [Myxococcota bacterium]
MLPLLLLGCSGCSRPLDLPPATPGPGFDAQPNILLVVIDTLRADRLSLSGYPRPTSPELDARAAAGLLFTNVWAPTSWTRPSVAAMLTGLHPAALGISDERQDAIPPAAPMLTETLQSAGYATFGMTANPNLNARFGFDRGFDTYIDSEVMFDWMLKDGADGVSATHNLLPTSRDISARALEFARSHPEQPALLFLDMMEVHEHTRHHTSLMTRSEHQGTFKSPYDDAIRQLSADLDALITDLTNLPGWQDSLVVITSDHGEGLDSHPSVPDSRIHGRHLYDSQVRVPLIVWSPAGQAGTGSVDALLSLEDMPALLTGLAGLTPDPAPWHAAARAHVSLETRFRGMDKVGITDGMWLYIESRDAWGETLPVELQRVGSLQDGPKTDQAAAASAITTPLQGTLSSWLTDNPHAEPHLTEEDLSAEMEALLESIGYLE